ncbi:hypothetical protein KGV55_00495 [Candidatus Gracilibacteria bacterium]|nr:hypothetical protein [Candidatus Gracilibacteria bacterium]
MIQEFLDFLEVVIAFHKGYIEGNNNKIQKDITMLQPTEILKKINNLISK